MCGICGFFAPPGLNDPESTLKNMMAPLYRRGPDDEGTYIHRNAGEMVALGVRRLAIIDLDTGKQPMQDSGGNIVVAQNGEIYNYTELRDRLKGNHRFRTRSDTETIIHLYEEKGEELFGEINGMFAIAIFDHEKREFLLARDRIGKKPLYYWHTPGSFCFSSELNSLLQFPGVPREFNPDAVAALFSFLCIPAPMTIYRGIQKLEPGHLIKVSIDEISKKRYWSLPETGEYLDNRDFRNRFRDLFFDAVKIRTRSDVPIGILLSGGMDSTAVLAGAVRCMTGIPSFTASFEEKDYDETRYARLAAEHFNSPHFTKTITQNVENHTTTLLERFGEPFADPSFFPTYEICSLASENVKVVLTGDGADELFGGYRKNKAAKLVDFIRGLSDPIYRLGIDIASIHKDLARLFGAAGQPFYLSYVDWESGTSFDELSTFFTPEFINSVVRIPEEIFEKLSPGNSLLERSLAADLNLYLPNDLLSKMDMASMACSLEARSPFLDYRIVELVASLPAPKRTQLWGSKKIIGNLIGDLIPRKIVKRSKHGFVVPLDQWVRALIVDTGDSVFDSESLTDRSIYKKDGILTLRDRILHENGVSQKEIHQIWNLYLLESWFAMQS